MLWLQMWTHCTNESARNFVPSAAAEISAMIAEEGFDFLDAPIKRVYVPDTPVPFSLVLEKFWMPDEEDLIKAANEIMQLDLAYALTG